MGSRYRLKSVAAVAVALACAAAPAPAQPGNPTSNPIEERGARRAKALELARLVEPREKLLDPRREAADFKKGAMADEALRDLEAQYPGILDAMWKAGEPEVERQVAAQLPAFWEKLADIYAAGMTASEIDAASGFFRSTTGRRLVTAVNQGVTGPVAEKAAVSGDPSLSAADLARIEASAAANLADEFSAGKAAAIEAFAQSPAGLKMLALKPQVEAVTLQWLNVSDPEGDARLDKAMGEAMEAYVAAAGKRRGKRAR